MKAFAGELKAVADATQVLGSETGATGRHAYALFQVGSFTGVHTSVDLKGFEVVTMVRRLARRSTLLLTHSSPPVSLLS